MELNNSSKVWYTKSKRTAERGDFFDILIVDTNEKIYKIFSREEVSKIEFYKQNELGVTVIEVTKFAFDFMIKAMLRNGYKEIN